MISNKFAEWCSHRPNPGLEHFITPERKRYFRLVSWFATHTDVNELSFSRPCSWDRRALLGGCEISPTSQIGCYPEPRSCSGERPSEFAYSICTVKNKRFFSPPPSKGKFFFVTYITVDVLNERGNATFFFFLNCQGTRAKEARLSSEIHRYQ